MVDHLYVMQASTGRIKIGRSSDPERRRIDIQNASGQRIALIAVLEGQGNHEWEIHSRLSEYREIGEWFSCTQASKAAICLAVGLELNFKYRSTADLAAEKARQVRSDRIEREMDVEWQAKIRTGIERWMGHPISPEWDHAHDLEERWMDGLATLDQVNEARAKAELPLLAGPQRRTPPPGGYAHAAAGITRVFVRRPKAQNFCRARSATVGTSLWIASAAIDHSPRHAKRRPVWRLGLMQRPVSRLSAPGTELHDDRSPARSSGRGPRPDRWLCRCA